MWYCEAHFTHFGNLGWKAAKEIGSLSATKRMKKYQMIGKDTIKQNIQKGGGRSDDGFHLCINS